MFAELGLSGAQAALLEQHYNLLMQWNRVLSLSSVEPGQVVERHYAEGLFLARHLPPGPLTVVDIGSGAGFPGVPVAVARPDCSVTLVESHQRKAVFLKEATRGVANVRVLAQRAEAVADRFDWAISRAVSYEDLGKALKRLARNAALLTGAEAAPPSLGFAWEEPVPLAGSRQRFLRIGHVSRETPPSE